MDLDQTHIHAFVLEGGGAAAQALARPFTLTLELPLGAQSAPATERSMGSIARIELDGKPIEDELMLAPAFALQQPALLTLTF